MWPPIRGYYAIVDVRRGQESDVAVAVARAERMLAARPCRLQLRAKGATAADLAALARGLLPAARAAGVPFCVNDRIDVALAIGADSVHLGQDDLPLDAARRIVAGRLEIGVSTHKVGQVAAATAGGADYIGYGPVFPTSSKERPDPLVGLEGLRLAASGTKVPVVAIGGIGLEQLRDVVEAGAAAAALIGAIDAAADPEAAARAANDPALWRVRGD